jgi:hypothetical protein
MRGSRAARVAGLTAFILLTSVGVAGGSASHAQTPLGIQRMQATYDKIHERAVDLGRHPRPALPALPTPRSLSTASSAFSTVSEVQQISRDILPTPPGAEPDTQQEPDIAVDPNDPNVVVAVFQQGRFFDIASVDPGYTTSHDGGRTWVRGNFPHLTQTVGGPYERASDPVVAFGPDGAVYITTIALDEINDFRTAVTIQRSDDGGLTFGDPVIIREDANLSVFNDKEWVAVDTFPASPHFGRIYVAWDRIAGSSQPPQLSYSDNRGATWSRMKQLSSVPALGTIPLVQPDGNLTVEYLNVLSFDIVAQTSKDGGQTFGPVVTIDTCLATDPPDQRDGGCIPGAAVDPVTGFLYVGWTDSRFRSDGLDDAVVTRSTDGGATWGPLVKVNPDGSGSGLEHMTTALGAYAHRVHVSYLTRSKVGQNFVRLVRERYSRSTDDGATFGGELIIGPVIDLQWSANAGGLHFLGDYMGIAATTSSAHPVWCRSSRPAQPETYHQTTWTATIEE